MLTFTGNAPAGKYYIYLMAEDRIPVPKSNHVVENNPMSTVPVHLSLTGETFEKILQQQHLHHIFNSFMSHLRSGSVKLVQGWGKMGFL